MPKRKHTKKNKVVPCTSTNTHAKERITYLHHKSEVVQRKIAEMMEQRKKQMEEQKKAKLDTSSPTLDPTEKNTNIIE